MERERERDKSLFLYLRIYPVIIIWTFEWGGFPEQLYYYVGMAECIIYWVVFVAVICLVNYMYNICFVKHIQIYALGWVWEAWSQL